MPIFDAFRNSEIELVDAIDSIGFGICALQGARVRSFWSLIRPGIEVLICVRWTATFNAVDDIPALWIFHFGLVRFIGDAELARAASVDCGIRSIAVIEFQKLRRAGSHLLATGRGQAHTMTRKVAARGVQRILRIRALDRRWR